MMVNIQLIMLMFMVLTLLKIIQNNTKKHTLDNTLDNMIEYGKVHLLDNMLRTM